MMGEDDLWREVLVSFGLGVGQAVDDLAVGEVVAPPAVHLRLLDHFSQEAINAVVITLKRYN